MEELVIIYTSQKHQFGKKLNILGEIVEFDNFGKAEVSKGLSGKIVEYNNEWYSLEKFAATPVVKPVQDEKLQFEVEQLKAKIEKLKKIDESRISSFKALEVEKGDLVKSLQNVTKEKEEFASKIETLESNLNNSIELGNAKFELALKDVEELKSMCAKVEIEESKYSKLRSKTKIIELIIEETFNK